jgi:hypothetical protein
VKSSSRPTVVQRRLLGQHTVEEQVQVPTIMRAPGPGAYLAETDADHVCTRQRMRSRP